MFELYFIDNFSLRAYLNIKKKINGSYSALTNRVYPPNIPPWACLYLLTTLDENKNTFIKNSTNKKYNLDDSKVDSILSVLKLIFLRKDKPFNIFENNLEIIKDNQPHMVSFLYIIVRRFIRRLFPTKNKNDENDENDEKNFNSCLPQYNTDFFYNFSKGGMFNKIRNGGFKYYTELNKVGEYDEEELLNVFNGFYKKYKEKLEKRESIDFSVKRMLIVFQLFLVAKRILNQEDAPFPEPKEPKSTLTKIGNLFKNQTTNQPLPKTTQTSFGNSGSNTLKPIQTTNQPLPKTPQTSIGKSVSIPLKPIQTTNQPLPKSTLTKIGNSVSIPLKPEKPKIGKSVFPFKTPWRAGKNKTKRNIDRSKKSNKTLKNKTRR